MNVLELEVRGGVGRLGELEFPAPGHADGPRLRIGFRPYAVQISTDLAHYRYRAVLRRTYFLGIMLRLELELPSGLTLRSRMTKEEYAQLGLADGTRSLLPNPQLPRARQRTRPAPARTPIPLRAPAHHRRAYMMAIS